MVKNLLVVAFVPVALRKVKSWSVEEPVARMFEKVWREVNVLAVYVFGMVVEEFTKLIALVVENPRPREE